MTFAQSLIVYAYAAISAILLQTYKISLYFYINYPTVSSAIGTILFIYITYRALKQVVRLLLSSLLMFIRLVVVTLLGLAGFWCYIRGPSVFISDVQFLTRLVRASFQDVKSNTGEFVHELGQDGYSFTKQDYDSARSQEFDDYFTDANVRLRLQDWHQLVELFGLNLVQFYRLGAENLYRLATSDFVRNHYNQVFQEFNAQYRDL